MVTVACKSHSGSSRAESIHVRWNPFFRRVDVFSASLISTHLYKFFNVPTATCCLDERQGGANCRIELLGLVARGCFIRGDHDAAEDASAAARPGGGLAVWGSVASMRARRCGLRDSHGKGISTKLGGALYLSLISRACLCVFRIAPPHCGRMYQYVRPSLFVYCELAFIASDSALQNRKYEYTKENHLPTSFFCEVLFFFLSLVCIADPCVPIEEYF